ncbi:hypothetical protein [Microbulbifer sp. YPW16]|uniref:hypothetical protein n=1 Tax=Microbulbifer sp. YPW16 TaxID=2904242 RepID=UPI001E5B2FF5|nr:hypothetical protein [Microbulbifer sp. YPW16]UHQ54938.1 hypothetical protein LVE68_15740 [Microbulbifer sp. YPW16]
MSELYGQPGVFVDEIPVPFQQVHAVETAVPVFIGYTERIFHFGQSLLNRVVEIRSLAEFAMIFGQPPAIGNFEIHLDADGNPIDGIADPNKDTLARFRLAYALKHYFLNGGGRCYVVSVGSFDGAGVMSEVAADHLGALSALARTEGPTLMVMPDLSGIRPAVPGDLSLIRSIQARYYDVLRVALDQCAETGDRFLIADPWDGGGPVEDCLSAFRDGISSPSLEYGAAYFPSIHTTLPWRWDEQSILVMQDMGQRAGRAHTLADLKGRGRNARPELYRKVRAALDRHSVTLPPSAAMAGIYCAVDRSRGVWETPANIALAGVRSLAVEVDSRMGQGMTVHSSGTAINPLRYFTDKGNRVWGARTLAGDSNEWRYINVRRYCNMVRVAVRRFLRGLGEITDSRYARHMVESAIGEFLTAQWRAGALQGTKPEDAFFSRCYISETAEDGGRIEPALKVSIGLATIRPAEFIIINL